MIAPPPRPAQFWGSFWRLLRKPFRMLNSGILYFGREAGPYTVIMCLVSQEEKNLISRSQFALQMHRGEIDYIFDEES